MQTSCKSCPLRKMGAFVPFDAAEVAFMTKFKVGELQVEAGTPILMEGSNAPQLYTALSGMGLRYKLTADGDRQVINLVFPGEFLGLQAGVMKEMGHSVEATTDMKLCVFDRSNLWMMFRDQPERAFDLTWLAAVEEHFLGESLLSLGQRDALSSVAWALLRIALRGDDLNLMRGGAMRFPYTQRDLADLLGLSLVHTNKTLRRLRERQIATWRDGVLQVHDLAALRALAQVDDDPPPRRPLI